MSSQLKGWKLGVDTNRESSFTGLPPKPLSDGSTRQWITQPPVEDHRIEWSARHDAPCAEHGRARGATMASHLGGATVHSRGPTQPGLPWGGQGVYGSTPVPSAVMR